ncbi:futalosine hydrolase [Streptomyces roseolilacinus]|uniref:futalosine hydrolase n=1 Tax=Streptomyces roseolilacinus TaxID=66904 RepID=UPI00167BD6CD|nr:futalosine hydrolase [Streptomyces roseolilacinus]
MRVLVVTAVAAEAHSVAGGLVGCAARSSRPLPSGHTVTGHLLTGHALARPAGPAAPVVDVLAAGVGPAAAAVGAATALATAPYPYDLVITAGIGGGFAPRAPIGSLVVSDSIVAADLGADTPGGYLPVEELGFGRSVHTPPAALTARLAEAVRDTGLPCLLAPVLTVSTVTGTAARAAELTARHPRAGAEAMEGFGVAEAAAAHGVPAVEVRAVSNTVGPRDRAAWRIGEALGALRAAFEPLSTRIFREE